METPNDMFSCPPDVSPEDVWDDPACLEPDGRSLAVLLPPKRVKEDKPCISAKEHGDGGLRIGTRTSSNPGARASIRLEVTEINDDVVRLQPEETEAARIPRQLVFQEKPDRMAELAMAVEIREWGESRKQPLLWMIAAGMAAAAIVVSGIYLLPRINKPNETRDNQGGAAMKLEPLADAKNLNDMLTRKAEAKRVLKSFANASSAEEFLPLVREPETVISLIREAPRPRMLALSNEEPLKIISWGAREQQSLTYGILRGLMVDYSEFETYFVVSKGRLVLDWKASTAYGTADFSELAENRGNPAEIRGWIEAVEFYSQAYSENSHQSYQLASPDKQQFIWIYARRGSEPHQALDALIKGGYITKSRKEPRKVTVRLAPGPAGSLPGQWEIVELLHKEWIAP